MRKTALYVIAWFAAERTLGDPGLHAPVVVDYPASDRRVVFAATQDGLRHPVMRIGDNEGTVMELGMFATIVGASLSPTVMVKLALAELPARSMTL